MRPDPGNAKPQIGEKTARAKLGLGVPSVPPGYKQTEVGVIPEEWKLARLSDLVVYGPKNGYSGRSGKKSRGTPTLSLGTTSSGSLVLNEETIKRLDETIDRESDLYLKPGDVLVQRSNTPDLVGTTAVFDGPPEVYVYPDLMMRMRFRDEATAHWFWRYANSGSGRRFFVSVAAGSSGSMPKISGENLRAMQIPVPPLPEQRAIAAALSGMDALLASLDRLIAKQRDLKQAAMQQLLTGHTRLPGFHGEWVVKTLGEICEIAMGRTPPRLNQAYWGRGYKWLSIADLQTKVVSTSHEEITDLAASMMTIIPKGTLLMSFKLSLGRLCFAGCDLFTNEAICSFNKLQENAEFLYYVLGRTDFSLYGKQAVKGYTLNKESLKIIEVLLPTLPEQTAIAEVLSDMDAELAALEQRRDKTRALKQGMMQELLTGRTRLV